MVIGDAAKLSDDQKTAILKQCLILAIEEETYESTTIYPELEAQARTDHDQWAAAAFQGQVDESKELAGLFLTAAKNFGLLSPIEHLPAERYGVALKALEGEGKAGVADEHVSGLWICEVCSMIHDPTGGDPDSGIDPGTPFEAIPDDWSCTICGVRKPALCLTEKQN